MMARHTLSAHHLPILVILPASQLIQNKRMEGFCKKEKKSTPKNKNLKGEGSASDGNNTQGWEILQLP